MSDTADAETAQTEVDEEPTTVARMTAYGLFATVIAMSIAMLVGTAWAGWLLFDNLIRPGELTAVARFAVILSIPLVIIVGVVICDIVGRILVRKAQRLRNKPNFRILEPGH